jgi:DNA-directed RNA polymerase subunit H (RpoH/RPB5)
MSKDLLNLKRASIELVEQRGFNTEFERPIYFNDAINDMEVFKNYIINIIPERKNDNLVKFFEQEKINPLYQFRQYLSAYYPPKGNNEYNNPDGCVVYFASATDNKKVSKEDIAYFCRMLDFFGVTNGIIISKTELPQTFEDICEDYIPCRIKKSITNNPYGCFIQHYLDQELYFNPLNHVMVPKHRILSFEEIEQLKIKASQLPKISILDPISKRLGARDKDIIEITRKSLISKTTVITEEEISYRVVTIPPKTKKK